MPKKHRKHRKTSGNAHAVHSISVPKIEMPIASAPPERKNSATPEINHSTARELKTIFLIVGFLLILTTTIVIISNRTDYLNQISDTVVQLLNIQ